MKHTFYKVIKPDSIDQFPSQGKTAKIFLAGSIELGVAENWQLKIEKELEELPVTIYNPRRDSWDSSWIQRESNDQFRKQVNWEMDKLEAADIIFLNFVGDTKSPISLLELGLHADENIIVADVEVTSSRFVWDDGAKTWEETLEGDDDLGSMNEVIEFQEQVKSIIESELQRYTGLPFDIDLN
jgi:hypothetical protein